MTRFCSDATTKKLRRYGTKKMGLLNHPKESPIRSEGVEATSIISSSDSEEDYVPAGSYTVLPQDIPDNYQEDSDFQDTSEDELENKEAVVNDEHSINFEVTQLWNSSNHRSDIAMDSTKVEQIKSAMAGFKLPSTSIPQWAKQIPEEKWKVQLLNKFLSKN